MTASKAGRLAPFLSRSGRLIYPLVSVLLCGLYPVLYFYQRNVQLVLFLPWIALLILVVDGRQPGYSEGATLDELAAMILEFGGYTGMNMDGGGSSTLVRESATGSAQVLNSPVDQGIPGRERVVGNHLGIYAGGNP